MVKAHTNATREEEAKENEKVRKELVAAMARKARAEAKPAYGVTVTERGDRSDDGSGGHGDFGFTRVGCGVGDRSALQRNSAVLLMPEAGGRDWAKDVTRINKSC